jgi:carbonic anhydrase
MTSKIIVASLLAVVAATLPAAAQDHHWGYEGEADPSHWGDIAEEFKECAVGQEQSPIDLTPTKAIHAEFSPAEIHWTAFAPTVVDNGHTVQVNTNGKGGYVELNGVRYDLVQFHFHHESEHTVDGAHSPLEVHFVNKSEAGDLLVLGVLLNPGEANAALGAVEAEWPAVGAETTSAETIDPSVLLPANHASFRYEGSLTTPPCSQIVTWNVFVDPVEVSAEQIDLFASHYANNARPIQALNRRFLLTDAS